MISRIFKYTVLFMILFSSFNLFAECETDLETSGSISLKTCDPKVDTCIPAAKALYEYVAKIEDNDSVYTIAVTSSPWRLYDGENRIFRLEDLAAVIKSALTEKMESVLIYGSWSAARPNKTTKSIVEKLSVLLDNFPVNGMDGFLWLKADGSTYTTKQAFTMRMSGPYTIKKGEDVMASLTSGWLADLAETFIKKKDADGLLLAGVAWDCYILCEDKALNFFELAAQLSNPIAAYNAAVIYIERGGADNLARAKKLLDKAVSLGDKKSEDLLALIKVKN